jgi:phosphohistidine phosphatase
MNLYLMQHGRPLPKEENPKKPLSDKGIKDVKRMAVFLSGAGIVVEAIFHSGKTRARQTAEIMAQALCPQCAPVERTGLAPKDHVGEIVRDIEKADKDMLLVGHLPHLGSLTALLITGDAARPVAAFQQGAVLCLRPNETLKGWQIAWMLAPEIMAS